MTAPPGAHSLWDIAARQGTGAQFTGLRPVYDCADFSGPAFTVRIDYNPSASYPVSEYRIAEIVDTVPAGHVLIFDVGAVPLTMMGGLAAERLRVIGAAGVVVNGLVRDVDELAATGVPVFARGSGFRSIASHARMSIVDFVVIEGTPIHAGDTIAGCASGVVCVPKASADAIHQDAVELDGVDAAMFTEIRAGAAFSDVWAKYKT
jgi:regulator of RNase E activity RraA